MLRPTETEASTAICENALADDSHELVNHFDARHIEQHGMAIVAAGSKLDAPAPRRAPTRT